MNRFPSDLHGLEQALEEDLKLINIPPTPWIEKHSKDEEDVVIIGAGMAGITIALALYKQGITKIKIFDANPQGKEGPWITYARMKILRSPKNLMGPALNIANLTFQAWYEAQFGKEKWEKLGKIPTPLWMEYLVWYRKVLRLPVENDTALLSIKPQKNLLQLTLKKHDQTFNIFTHKLVLATGRGGFGGFYIPSFMDSLPKSHYAHTGELIDFHLLKGKEVAIIGGGSSAFDAAGSLLENGAKKVEMLVRPTRLSNMNRGCSLVYPGLTSGFYDLDDLFYYHPNLWLVQ